MTALLTGLWVWAQTNPTAAYTLVALVGTTFYGGMKDTAWMKQLWYILKPGGGEPPAV